MSPKCDDVDSGGHPVPRPRRCPRAGNSVMEVPTAAGWIAVPTLPAALEIISKHEIQTTTKFVSANQTANFGTEQISPTGK